MSTSIPSAGSVSRVVVHGDFTCPWSYLTWRRTEALRADGVQVDWHTVEHDPWHVVGPVDAGDRFTALRSELDRVQEHLLPGEVLPHTLAGFVPFTGAATSGYAEAYGAHVGAPARRLLFEAFWRRGVDLNDARVVRILLVDAMRGCVSEVELLTLWGYALDVTGGPITRAGWQTVRGWRAEWDKLCADPDTGHVVPIVQVDDHAPVFGVEAVDRVGALLSARGLDPGQVDFGRDPADVSAA
jgi:hypothetical protein